MLGKLIKHEWKSTYKMCGILLLALAVVTVMGCISFRTPMWVNLVRDNYEGGVSAIDIAGIFMLLIYVFSLVGVIWGLIIYIGVQFYRSMYTEQGYLTHTLPVTSHQLLFSKFLIGGLWYVIIQLLIVVSIFLLVYSLATLSASGGTIWKEITDAWSVMSIESHGLLGSSPGGYVVFWILSIIFGAFASVMSLFGAITIGQLSSKHKVLMSIVSYLGICVVEWIISYITTLPLLFGNITTLVAGNEVESEVKSISISGVPDFLLTVGIKVILASVLYFLSNYIITKKLNLE